MEVNTQFFQCCKDYANSCTRVEEYIGREISAC